jgi:hypothetical protein
MSDTKKPLSERDYAQALQSSYNQMNATLSVDGFIVGKIGHKVTLAVSSTTVPDDTELYSFYDVATLLYQIRIIYTDGTRNQLLSAERIA